MNISIQWGLVFTLLAFHPCTFSTHRHTRRCTHTHTLTQHFLQSEARHTHAHKSKPPFRCMNNGMHLFRICVVYICVLCKLKLTYYGLLLDVLPYWHNVNRNANVKGFQERGTWLFISARARATSTPCECSMSIITIHLKTLAPSRI